MNNSYRIQVILAALLPALFLSCTKDVMPSFPSAMTTAEDLTPSSSVAVPEDEEDAIANTKFARTITLVWSSTGVDVRGDDNGIVSVSGTHVTVNATTTKEKIRYELSGSCDDGSFKVYSNNKQCFSFNGLTLTNPSGAAVNNQGKKRCFVVVNGTNTLSDGASAAYTATEEEDLKAVFFSEGQLIFSGTGSLAINALNAMGKAALTTDDYIHVMEDGPSITVSSGSSAGNGIRGKEYILISGGTIRATVAAAMKKGFSSDSLVVITGGETTISASGGTAYDEDDGDWSGSAGIKADYGFKMTGGTVNITNTGQGGKGLRVGGSSEKGVHIFTSEVSGGTLTINVTGSNDTSHDVSAKGVKVGWAVESSTKGPGAPPGGGPGGGGMGGESNTYSDMTGDFIISGGVVRVKSANAEAFEVKRTLTVSDGELFAYSNGDDAINSGSTLTITGGKVCGISTANDGIDANGNFYIKGGIVYASGKGSPELALDANSEGGFKLYIQGGTVVAIGGIESGASVSQPSKTLSSWGRNVWYGITSGSTSFAFKTPSSGGNGLYCYGSSTPSVSSGVNVSGTSFWDGYGNADF